MSYSVYSQVKLQCTSEAIKSLLRDVQDRSAAAKSETNISVKKEELVRNLRLAVENQHANLDEVRRLLWVSEEVGKQHVSLLRPAPTELIPAS